MFCSWVFCFAVQLKAMFVLLWQALNQSALVSRIWPSKYVREWGYILYFEDCPKILLLVSTDQAAIALTVVSCSFCLFLFAFPAYWLATSINCYSMMVSEFEFVVQELAEYKTVILHIFMNRLIMEIIILTVCIYVYLAAWYHVCTFIVWKVHFGLSAFHK